MNIRGAYFSQLAAGAIPTSGGAFTFTGASGGADVGSFTSDISFTGPVMTWTNQSTVASVDRAQGVTVTWNGGNPGTYIAITGNAATPSGLAAGFTCWAPVDARTFTVPAARKNSGSYLPLVRCPRARFVDILPGRER